MIKKITIAILLAVLLQASRTGFTEPVNRSRTASYIMEEQITSEPDNAGLPSVTDELDETQSDSDETQTTEDEPQENNENQPETEEFIPIEPENTDESAERDVAQSVTLSSLMPREEFLPIQPEEEPAEQNIAPITQYAGLLPHEAIVKTYSELKRALADNNGITTIYFGDSITMESGIEINPAKRNIIVSGLNPLDMSQTKPFTLTDLDSSSFYETIYIDTAGVNTLTVRDLIITGKNFYGPFSVFDNADLAGVTITYERVNYNGPQMGYHRKGKVCFRNCAVRIHSGNQGSSPNQEFSEVKRLVFEGSNTIETSTNAYSIFWHPGGGTFEIADYASLVLTSPNTSAAFGVFYAESALNTVNIKIGERAVFDMKISGVVSYAANVTLGGFTVREGGSFSLKTTASAIGPVMDMGGELIVEKDASFSISAYGNTAYAVLRQSLGDIKVANNAIFQITAQSPYMALINLIGRAFICDDPAGILLYNANRDIVSMSGTGRIYVSAQQVNYWNLLSAGGLDNPPKYRWDKPDKTKFWFDGTIESGIGGDFSSIKSNYTSGDPPGVEPKTSSIGMNSARVLAFGRLELTVINPTVKSKTISGITEPGAAVRALLTQQGESYTLPEVIADSQGVFHIPVDIALYESGVVTVISNRRYLTTTEKAVVIGDGKLEFFVPDVMEFLQTELSSSVQIISRLHSNWKMTVSNTGSVGSRWNIYARLNGEMMPVSESYPSIKNSLIFVDRLGNESIMSTDADTLIIQDAYTGSDEVFTVAWDEDKGVLLKIKPGAAFANTAYTAQISWTLVNAP